MSQTGIRDIDRLRNHITFLESLIRDKILLDASPAQKQIWEEMNKEQKVTPHTIFLQALHERDTIQNKIKLGQITLRDADEQVNKMLSRFLR